MSGRRLLLTCVSTGLLGLVLIATTASRTRDFEGLAVNAGGLIDCVVCRECPTNKREHIAVVDNDGGVLTAKHEECRRVHFNACINADEHGTCPGEGGGPDLVNGKEVTRAELVAIVTSLAESGNEADLSEVLHTVRGVHFVPDRHAIQIEGCDKTLIAHVPLARPLLVALADD